MHGPKVYFIFPIKKKRILINYLFFFALCGRFAETEGVAALSIFVSQYKMTVKEEPKFAAETFEERKTRILSARIGLTTTWVFFCGSFGIGS